MEDLDDFIDSHGSLSIVGEEDWANLLLEKQGTQHEIVGVNLNTLLYGSFKLLGSRSLTKRDFSCSLSAWSSLLESAFVYLLQICPINDVLSRIEFLLNGFPEFEELCIGAVQFLCLWLSQYRPYLHSQHIFIIHCFAVSLSSNIRHRAGTDVTVSDLSEPLIAGFDRLLDESERALEESSASQLHCQPYSGQSISTAQVDITEGSWDGQLKADIKKELKKSLESGPQIKLEIFGGGAALFDSDSDDSSSDNLYNSSKKVDNDLDDESERYPQTRVCPGVSLLVAPSRLHLLDLDPVELARQWTLVDHALFMRISLHGMLRQAAGGVSGGNDEIYNPHKLLDSTLFGGTKRLVDRFNAASAWATHCILSHSTPLSRAEVIIKLTAIAVALQSQGNFSALMAVLTAIQQGCIARLTLTFAQVPEETKSSISHLKRLMAAGRNYARYREELQRLLTRIPFERLQTAAENKQKAAFELSKKGGSTSSGYKRVDWRVSCEQRLEPALKGKNLFGSSSTLPVADDPPAATGEEFKFDAPVEAVVPHLVAHSAALAAVAEAHPDYHPQAAHLYNLIKWRQCTMILTVVQRLQSVGMKYNFRPVRVIQAALHSQWRSHVLRSSAAQSAAAQRLYNLSEMRESADFIRRGGMPLPVPSPTRGKKTVTIDSGKGSNSSPSKYQKGNGNMRVKAKAALMSEDDDNMKEEQPRSLTRMISQIILGKSDTRDEEESDNEEDEEDEEEEEGEGEEEEVEPTKKKKKLRPLKHLLRAISYKV